MIIYNTGSYTNKLCTNNLHPIVCSSGIPVVHMSTQQELTIMSLFISQFNVQF